jgi:hypothetical protein
MKIRIGMDNPANDLRSAAHQLVDTLPVNATWDDLMYQVYVRQCIDAGLEDAKHDRVTEIEAVRTKFGLQ